MKQNCLPLMLPSSIELGVVLTALYFTRGIMLVLSRPIALLTSLTFVVRILRLRLRLNTTRLFMYMLSIGWLVWT